MSHRIIPFNKPYLTGKELEYIRDAVESGHISGNGKYTKLCQNYFSEKYGFKNSLLTTSCTDALEMAAILSDIQPGDEVIIPSYTFVSTANAFVLRGAKIIFADSEDSTPNIDADKIEELITKNTKAIIIVHYGGVACNMDKIMNIINKHNLILIEDAAQAIDSYYKDKILGSFGHFATFSFHETKNIMSGEGGLLVINDEKYTKRAEIIWEKGTNRAEFFRGKINKYEWVDIGSSFLPADTVAAFLYAQLENTDNIQQKRKEIWDQYYLELKPLEKSGIIKLPFIPEYATNNAHLFYFLCRDSKQKEKTLELLNKNGINAVFHYLCLHNSSFYKEKYFGDYLSESEKFENCLIRLPMYYGLKKSDISYITSTLNKLTRT